MIPSDADLYLLWKSGRLRYKLHSGQRTFYDKFRAWQKESEEKRRRNESFTVGKHTRVFYLNAGRRWGKDHTSLVLAIEECIRRPKALITYATAYKSDIVSIAIPLVERILGDCPEKLKPIFKMASSTGEAGYMFPNGSLLKLLGFERDPNSARGRWSDGVFLSESSYIDKLEYTVSSVLTPMFLGLPHAFILMNSTPSPDPGHDSLNIFMPDAQDRNAYFHATTFSNPLLSTGELDELSRTLGGPLSLGVRREMLCEVIRDDSKTVIPEFDKIRHVKSFALPKYGRGYTIVDPGYRDMAGVICLVHDFERGKILVVSEWCKPGANTQEIAYAIKECEAQAFKGLQYWDQSKFKENPFLRYSDTELRLIADLSRIHQMPIQPVDKDGAEASLHALRTAFQLDRIEISPACVKTTEHLEKAIWNRGRTSYERSERIGHADLLDCVRYGYRMINRELNPFPPPGIELEKSVSFDNLYTRPEYRVSPRRGVGKLSEVLPQRRFRAKGR